MSDTGTISGKLPDGANIIDQSDSRRFPLGTRYILDERVFKYAHIKKDANVLGRGRPVVSFNNASIEKGAKLGVLTKGASSVLWTAVQREILRNQYKDGYLLMQGGFTKGIRSNNSQVAGGTILLQLKEQITEEDAAAGNYGILCESIYSNVIERTFGQTGPGLIVGVPGADFDADKYCWLQTWGPCGVIGTVPVLNDSGQVTGIAPGLDTNSAIQTIATDPASVQEERIIGHHIPYNTNNWDNEAFRMLFLTINP